ncbi:hypothetical protein GQ55_6G282700 [Panicum hallii var. hallii]|uniref:KIB1-4 beta-propeller domain-containing protein n=1 Tax=Panicum hallii var. hallii TaxID=1504633 RepID=A0A2T7DAG5_9POAL|nr:hypothetical protein GQ55_6G282700 [Panicum hallii var. hallii]
MAMANRRRGRSPPATASASRDPVAAAPSLNFPPDLLREIARRLTSLQEFFAGPSLNSAAPLLLVPDAAAASHALLYIRRGFLRFRFTRSHLTGETADIHSLGCRVAVDLRGRCQLRVVHVLTGERTRLPSPPSPFSGLLLSDDLVVACNAAWRILIGDPYRFHDLIFVNGTLYALVTPGYCLAAVKLSDNSDSVEFEFLGVLCELVLVTRPKPQDRRTFHVFRWQSGEQEWERITSLGGCTLFLANYRFAGCLGPDHQGIRGDCIYYTIPGLLRVHSLVDESVTERIINYPIGKVPMEFCQSVWVFPSMC